MSEDKKIQLKKMFVGHYIENVPEDCKKKVSYVMQGDGIWCIRKAAIGTFVTQVAKAKVPGLESNLEESWMPNVPKIPMSLLYSTVNFFKEIHKKMKSEVYVQFYYDVENEEFILHCPEQTVSAASVNYKNDKEYEGDKFILVLEMHSHGSMGAFFSATDDKDEKADRFFGVIGHISQQDPEMKFRLCLGGKAVEVSTFSIFQSEEHDSSFPKEWLDRVKEEKATYKGLKGVGKFGRKYGSGKYYGGSKVVGEHDRRAWGYSSSMDRDYSYGYGWEEYMDRHYDSVGAQKNKQTALFDDVKGINEEELEVSDELERALEEVGDTSHDSSISYGNYIREDGLIHFVDDEGVIISSIDDSILTEEDVYDDVDGSFYEGEDVD